MMDLIKIDTQKNAHYPMPSRFIARGMSREHFTKLVEELSFRGINPADAIDDFSDAVTRHQAFFFEHDSATPNTQRNYLSAISQLQYWLVQEQGYDHGVIPLPMSVDMLCEYITWRATDCPALRGGDSRLSYMERVELAEHQADQGQSVKRGVSKNTLALDIYAINRLHQASCLPSPTRAEAFRLVHKRLLKQKVANREISDRQTSALSDQHLAQMNHACAGATDLRVLRDRALLNLNFEAMLRGIEATTIQIQDLQRFPDGSGNLCLVHDKTNKTGIPRYLALSPQCMRYLKEYLTACGRTFSSNGYLFAGINSNYTTRSNRYPVSRDVVEGAFERAFQHYTDAHQSGMVEKFTTHSARIGAAIYLLEQGATHVEIMNNGRWKSLTMLVRYIDKNTATGAMHKTRRHLL